ncbi:acyltransferase family protein [Methylobacter luteus]|uniref:acyltransferase family protein n=1 Tax=Methylobacter luteus TaxID=415 RepID=UPI0018CAEF79|nr:acyltransferase [Methylobacter luteus]
MELISTKIIKGPFAMKLEEILNKEKNNLDIFRVIAACMVIYGHAYPLSPEAGQIDIVRRLVRFDYSGSLAVNIFFFLSGLVVTNSLLEKRNLIQFVISRIFRIWPALFITVFISAFILGPVLTKLPINEYFGSGDAFRYFYKSLILNYQLSLPGVFVDNPWKNSVNGSLWTISYEVSAYLIVLSLFMVGLFKSKILPLILFLVILIDPLLGNKLLFTWLPHKHHINMLAPCFAFGSILAFYKDQISINFFLILGAWLLFYLFRNCGYKFYFLYYAIFVSIIYIASLDFVIKLKPKSDISYGIYLWGFPVQQILASYFHEYGVLFNQVSALCISIILGFISWHLIEKRCISLGAKLGRKFRSESFCLHPRLNEAN